MPAIAFVLLCLPWLNPFSPGPVAQVMPLLFAWSCAAGVLLVLAADRQHGQRAAMVRALVLAWATAAAISAAIGLLQYFGASARFGVWINHADVGVAFGNLRQRNQFATLQNLGLAAALWLAVTARRSAAGASALAAWVSLGNAASGSRTGLLQLLLLVLLTLFWLGRGVAQQPKQRVQTVLLVALVAYTLALLVLPALAGLNPLESGALARLHAGDRACASRLTLWGNVLYLVAQAPWLGWGWGELDYAHFITLYPGMRFCDILDNAHNLPLHLAVELGLPAALLLCGAALWLAWRARPWAEREPTRQLAWAMLAVILLHSLLEYPLWYGPFQTAAVLAIWLLWWVRGASAGSLVTNESILCKLCNEFKLVQCIYSFPRWGKAGMGACLLLKKVNKTSPHPCPPPKAGGSHSENTTFGSSGSSGSSGSCGSCGSSGLGYKKAWQLDHYLYVLSAILVIVYCAVAAWHYRVVSQLYLNPAERAPAYQVNTLEKARQVWLYQDPVRFAELTTADLNAANAARLNALAKQMLHFSPEPRVVQILLDSARLLGRDDEVAFYTLRFQAAFPAEYATWAAATD